MNPLQGVLKFVSTKKVEFCGFSIWTEEIVQPLGGALDRKAVTNPLLEVKIVGVKNDQL